MRRVYWKADRQQKHYARITCKYHAMAKSLLTMRNNSYVVAPVRRRASLSYSPDQWCCDAQSHAACTIIAVNYC